jgi:hypothetical protein
MRLIERCREWKARLTRTRPARRLRRLAKLSGAQVHEDGSVSWSIDWSMLSGIDWQKARRENGVSDGEKLYAARHYLDQHEIPEITVMLRLEKRRKAGVPVWVDGRPLYRRLYLFPFFRWDGIQRRICTLEETRSALVAGKPELDRQTKEALLSGESSGQFIYNRKVPEEEAELALNILADAFDEKRAKAFYEDFKEEVLGELDGDEWFLPEKRIWGWMSTKVKRG